jgi:hypothetical protein
MNHECIMRLDNNYPKREKNDVTKQMPHIEILILKIKIHIESLSTY